MILEMITSKAVGVRPDGYRDPSWALLNYSWLQFIFYTPKKREPFIRVVVSALMKDWRNTLKMLSRIASHLILMTGKYFYLLMNYTTGKPEISKNILKR
jgi:hypothetical protein